jgi:predicted molibdopterin-dependent oxidoreductase YjgC
MRSVVLDIDGQSIEMPEGATILDAARELGIDTPTLCWAANLTPVNVCRVCVVELEGARTLVPSCARKVEPGMKVRTDSPRVRTSRKLVLELLQSSVDTSTAPALRTFAERYGAVAGRFGPVGPPAEAGARDHAHAGHHHACDGGTAATVHQPRKTDNALYVRDYGKCITCYKCVEACGTDAQNTFAIAVAGRGFEARISTEYNVPLPESACVYCGTCINVCPTGALMFKSEADLRDRGEWREETQTTTRTICPYCGVGCTLELTVQDNRIVRVMSPPDVSVTHGNLCIKGRFGVTYVHGPEPAAEGER